MPYEYLLLPVDSGPVSLKTRCKEMTSSIVSCLLLPHSATDPPWVSASRCSVPTLPVSSGPSHSLLFFIDFKVMIKERTVLAFVNTHLTHKRKIHQHSAASNLKTIEPFRLADQI